MAKENVSPEQGGLRVGIQGGGCSGLSYNIRFDTQPRERDRVYAFGEEAAPVTAFCRSEELYLSAWDGAGLRSDPDAAGIQLHQSELDEELWVWVELYGVATTAGFAELH